MELRIEQVAIPEKIAFNYEELKQELTDKVKMYETLVYTDEQIREARADRADLNRLKKALNDERIRREKEYMQPFDAFKAQVNEIIGIIDKPVAMIDRQVKEYEEKQKQEKKERILEYFMSRTRHEWLTVALIWNEKWLNASSSMKSIQAEIDARLATIESDLVTLSNLPEFAFEAVETYKTTLDLNKSIAEGHRLSELQKRKAEQERLRAEQEKVRAEQERLRREQSCQPMDSERAAHPAEAVTDNPVNPVAEASGAEWVSFKAYLTVEDAKALAGFFSSRNIEFKRI